MKPNKLILIPWSLLLLHLPDAAQSWSSAVTAHGHVSTTTTACSNNDRRNAMSVLHMSSHNRNPTPSSRRKKNKKRRLVVVGGGIGGLSSAFDARRMLHDDEIILVSDREQFQFTPSNPWVATRARTEQDISLSLTKILSKHQGIDFIHSAVTHLDPEQQTLTLKNGNSIEYDFLLIATGPRLAFEDIPGLGPEKYSTSVCTTPHASEAADAVDRLTSSPGPVVVGAVQGASCFGPAYEFALLLQFELEKRGGRVLVDKCPITFVTSEPYIGHLGLGGAGESKKILENLFAKKGIEWYTNCKVDELTSESVSIEYLIDDGTAMKKRSKTIPSKFNMLIPPFKGMDVWGSVPGLTDPNGMILIDHHQQSTAFPNIFAVGICVHMDALEETPIPTGAPKTGYMIESMGTAAIKNIRSMIDYLELHDDEDNANLEAIELCNRPLLNGLCITDFGNDGAIFLTLPQLPPRRTDITIDGRVATLAKIAFEQYFLYKIRTGDTDPYYEKYMLHLIGVDRTVKEKCKEIG